MFSSLHRQHVKKQVEKTPLDLIVIGGGITGAGIALDAVTRGLKVAVLEMQDFAAGTSSRSTKLIHGGLRYLKQFEVGVVAETGRERAIVYENGPHVTRPEWMMLPFYEGGTFGPWMTRVGLRIYDFLAQVKKVERRKMLSREEALSREPLLKEQALKGAGLYVEYKTDDARLTIEVMKKAVAEGAFALNYMKVTDLMNENNKLVGVEAEDQLDGTTLTIFAKRIVNAAGPWVDILREWDGSKQGKHLRLTKGIHLVFDERRFPLKQSIYFDTPDGRMVFAIPREGKTYVGTTDTVYDGDIAAPKVTSSDQAYILKAIDFMFPQVNIQQADIESSWAGLRPLIYQEGKDPSEISRKDEIFISDTGLISIAGGKLTGYRKMAENIVNLIEKQLQEDEGRTVRGGVTKQLPISGGKVGGSTGFIGYTQEKIALGMELGLREDDVKVLVQRYGSNIDLIFELYLREVVSDKTEHIDPLVFVLVLYSIKYEAAYKPVDFFIRRTGALFFNITWVHKHKESVIEMMGKLMNWSEEERQAYTLELEQCLRIAVYPADSDR